MAPAESTERWLGRELGTRSDSCVRTLYLRGYVNVHPR
jgi:hypothetical protein